MRSGGSKPTGSAAPRGRTWKAAGDRATTEAMLETAALELLEENGVLSGLNLREVADRVTVNRGLVYHYFGNRRALLRSALRRRGGQLATRLARRREEGRSFEERVREDFEAVSEAPEIYRLIALLVLDGDPRARVMPIRDESLRFLQADVDGAVLPADTDIRALHAVIVSATAGYALFRERFASELEIPLPQLDERVDALVGRLLAGFTASSRE